MKNSMCS